MMVRLCTDSQISIDRKLKTEACIQIVAETSMNSENMNNFWRLRFFFTAVVLRDVTDASKQTESIHSIQFESNHI